jgi:hypothetical protein
MASLQFATTKYLKQKKVYDFLLIGIVRDDLATTYDYDIIDQSLT